ncbi:MAG: hypothetical protein JOY80_10780, partial [Candidatus Dormibacteraeota bacterium]|nr:hypothetical protein [Candidatus Dormibacteraeota bacterium]
TNLGKTWAALILGDIVLVMLVVLVPITARALARELIARIRPGLGVASEFAIAGLVSALMAFAWAQAAPILTRPYFVWHGAPVSLESLNTLQMEAWLLPLVALGACAVRGVLEMRMQAAEPPPPLVTSAHRRKLPAPLALVLKVGLAVFILAGLMESWIDPIVVAFVMLVFLVLREPALRRLPVELGRVTRIPILPRLVAGAVVSGLLAIIFIAIFGADSVVRPIVLSTLLSLTVFTLLLPEHVLEKQHLEQGEP